MLTCGLHSLLSQTHNQHAIQDTSAHLLLNFYHNIVVIYHLPLSSPSVRQLPGGEAGGGGEAWQRPGGEAGGGEARQVTPQVFGTATFEVKEPPGGPKKNYGNRDKELNQFHGEVEALNKQLAEVDKEDITYEKLETLCGP